MISQGNSDLSRTVFSYAMHVQDELASLEMNGWLDGCLSKAVCYGMGSTVQSGNVNKLILDHKILGLLTGS